MQQIDIGPGYQVGFADFIRQRVDMPVIAVGMITDPFQAETIIRAGQADMVALAREFCVTRIGSGVRQRHCVQLVRCLNNINGQCHLINGVDNYL